MTERSKEEIEQASRRVREAADLAQRMAEFVVGETESSRMAIMASGILYASLASMHGMTMHDAMALLMDVYRRHEQFNREQGE